MYPPDPGAASSFFNDQRDIFGSIPRVDFCDLQRSIGGHCGEYQGIGPVPVPWAVNGSLADRLANSVRSVWRGSADELPASIRQELTVPGTDCIHRFHPGGVE